MENINWICKSKNVNNNIVWMCNPKIKEHFQSTYTSAILGTTAFPNTVDITLGPSSFGPTSDLAKNTTGFTKLGEWTLAVQDGSSAMNNEFFEGKTKGIMVYNGDRNITDWSKWPNEWHYRYQIPMLCGIDKNGFNAGAAVFEFQNYQEFNTTKFAIIFRNKSNPQNYYLMPRVDLYSSGNLGLIGYGADNFDLGATMDQQISRYKGLNWTPEISMRGQGGGNVVYNDVYEVFIKPFTRPTYPFKGEPKVNDFSNLDSSLASNLLLWLDGSDPLGDGSVLPDDSPVPYWFDKSSNKMRFIRHPQAHPQLKDGDRLPNGRKLRVPRCRTGMKNGLSVMRFNGVNGYFNNVNDPNDPTTDMWVQNPNHKNITEYTIISLQMTTDYPSQQGTIFRANDYSGNCKTMIGNVAYGAPMLSFLTNANNRNDGSTSKYWQSNINVLNKWSLFTTVVSTTNVSLFVNGVSAPNNLMDWQQGQTPYKSSDGIIDSFGMTCIVGGHTTNETGAAFIGDIGEFLFFKGALSDVDRQKVEGYLAVKWNLLKLLPSTNPYAVIPLPPIKVGSRVVLVEDPKLPPGPLGILFPGTVGIVSQINNQNSVLVYDSTNNGLLYWYKMTDLKLANSSNIQTNTPSILAPMVAPVVSPSDSLLSLSNLGRADQNPNSPGFLMTMNGTEWFVPNISGRKGNSTVIKLAKFNNMYYACIDWRGPYLLYNSADGRNWQPVVPPDDIFKDAGATAIIAFKNRLYVAVYDRGFFSTSDGNTWKKHGKNYDDKEYVDPSSLMEMKIINDKLYLIYRYNIWEFNETTNISKQISPNFHAGGNASINHLNYDSDKKTYLACCSFPEAPSDKTPLFYWSNDLVNWNKSTGNLSNRKSPAYYNLTNAFGKWWATGNSDAMKLVCSEDGGKTWNEVKPPVDSDGLLFKFGNTLFYCGGNDQQNQCFSTNDGINWKKDDKIGLLLNGGSLYYASIV